MSEPLDIEELSKLEAAATPGPWTVQLGDDRAIVAGNSHIAGCWPYEHRTFVDVANAAFIAASRSAVPALILLYREWHRRATELEAALAKARDDGRSMDKAAGAVKPFSVERAGDET